MASRTFADLSPYQAIALKQQQSAQNPLDAILGGVQQGIQLQRLPETIKENALNQQIAQAIQQAKLRELQSGKTFEVGNSLIRQNPQTGAFETVFTAPLKSTTETPESNQFIGFDANNQPIVFGPKSNTFRVGQLPQGVSMTNGSLLPKTTAPETQSFVGFGPDNQPIQFGNRGTGVSTAPVQAGTDVSGPLLPKTQAAAPRKGVLLQDDKGNIKYDVLSEGEEIPKGSRLFTEPKAEDESGIRKEFMANQVVKDFTAIAPQYQRINSAMDEAKTSKNYTAVDQTLINTFNRILDPQSVVKESEYARSASDQSVLNYLKGKLDPKTGQLVVGGAGLDSDSREAMQRMAKRFYDAAQNNYTQTSAFYSNVAKNRGFDPSLIVPPIGGFDFSSAPIGQAVQTPQSGAVTTIQPSAAGQSPTDALKWLQDPKNVNHPRYNEIRQKLGL